jgi:hypothetical protein
MVRVLKIFLGFSLLLGAQAFAAPPSAISPVSSSRGSRSKITCSRITGCR